MQDEPQNAEQLPAPVDLQGQDLAPSRDFREGLGRLEETGSGLVEALPLIVTALLILLGFILLGRLIKWLVSRFATDRRKHRNFALAIGRLTQGLVIVIGLLVAAVIVFPNFTPTKLLEFIGLGSVAIGFAFRDVLQNYLAGILLLLNEPFRIGDQIIFKEYEGTVEDIQTRATMVRTYDGRRVVIPNAELFTNSVLVNTAFENRRIEYDISIGYGDDIAQAKRIILEVLGQEESAKAEPRPDVLVFELGGDAVVLRARWWIDPPQRLEALTSRDAVLEKVKSALVQAGIDLPFPTRQVLFHDQTEDFDGDRRRQREGWPPRPEDPADTRAPHRRGAKAVENH